MSGIFKRLKEKWGIESNVQFFLINLVFALAGSSIVFLRPLIFKILGISPDWPFILKAFLYLLTVTPVYVIMIMLFSLVFGQFRFFWNYLRRAILRFSYLGGRGGNFRNTR